VESEDAARLLAPSGRLSRFEQDAIWNRIVATRTPWWRRPTLQLSAGLVIAAAVFALVIVTRPAPHTEELTPRGDASLALTLRCGAREPGVCLPGDRLGFDFGATDTRHYVALFARSPSGTAIWYVPADDGSVSLSLAEHTQSGVLDVAAVIDASYAPGRYELFAIVSPRPLSRAEIRGYARGDVLIPPPDVRIETRELVVNQEQQP
jgi:hypothetical protein